MDDTGLPQITDELPELSMIPTEDIPQAVRQAAEPAQVVQPRPNGLLLGLSVLGLAALLAIPLTFFLRSSQSTAPAAQSAAQSATQSATQPAPVASPAAPEASPADTLLGHLSYAEAPTSDLEPVADGKVLLRRSAAQKLETLIAAAAKEGVTLVPLSGFRSVAEQNSLFFDVKAERGQDPSERATVSAPPGYSEHHTGYAVDLGDGNAPSADLQLGFEKTRAFQWLQKNAAHYGFEMSFKRDNPMGVSYEPWHWRFVGDRQSLETFYRARQESVQAVDAPTGAADRQSTSQPTSQPTGQSTGQSTSANPDNPDNSSNTVQ